MIELKIGEWLITLDDNGVLSNALYMGKNVRARSINLKLELRCLPIITIEARAT